MRSICRRLITGLLVCGFVTMGLAAAPATLWVSAYYPGWQQHNLPPAEIDFQAVTHLVQFSVMPRADGSLDWTRHDLDDAHIKETVRLTHAAGRKILLCVGGADSAAVFRGAIAEKNRAAFVGALVKAVKAHGYDGLDLDMEPMEAKDDATYAVFVRELRAALNKSKPGALLTAAVGDQAELFAKLQDQFDQINVMTYDLSGAWEGWVTWHNSALWNGGVKFPGSTRELPGVDLKIREWLAAGIRADRLGLGLAFYGYEWSGADGPKQSLAGVKIKDISYADIMKTRFTPERYRWDEGAAVPYLSLAKNPARPTEGAAFISFDDERSLRLKIEYARKMKLGGAIIWELGSGWRSELPTGKRDPLLQAVKNAALVKRE
jgi:chitinase